MTWFTDIEEAVYSVVEYIPYVGTVYSFHRARIAYGEHNWATHWQSVANLVESSIRDIILFKDLAEPVPVVILHTMAESFTDKLIEIYQRNKRVQVKSKLDKEKQYVVVAESTQGRNENLIFKGKAKGVHLFHRSVFTGTLTHPTYAPNGEKIRLDIHQGLYDGAKVTFTWKWTVDMNGNKNQPQATLGFIQLVAGTPTKFKLSKLKGAGWEGEWRGQDFYGEIRSKDQIVAKTYIDHQEVEIDLRRQSESSSDGSS